MIKMQLTKELAKKALETYRATIIRRNAKETNLTISEILEADVRTIDVAIASIADAK